MQTLSVSDWAVLAVLAQGESHGFHIAHVFAKGQELGHIWYIQKPQVYRALEHLSRQGLAQPVRQELGEGGVARTIYAITAEGMQRLEGWLQQPVAQLRHSRSELRLKLAFLLARQADNQALLRAQLEVFRQTLEVDETQLAQADGIRRLSLLWRVEMARAAVRFVQQLLE